MNLSTRQNDILKAIINEHIRSAQPVGSKELVVQYDFGVSPATVRHEMNVLEKAGLLEQPHTSAGRIPTDLGYRVYVKNFSNMDSFPTRRHRVEIKRRVQRMRKHYQALAQETAHLLAELTEQAVISQTENQAERSGLTNLIKLPELKDEQLAAAIAQVFDHPELFMKKFKSIKESNKCTEVTLVGGAPVRVYIGNETGLGNIPISVMVSSYTINGNKQGHLVVLGPSRMAYGRNMALLSYLSRFISRGNIALAIAIILPGSIIIHSFPNTWLS